MPRTPNASLWLDDGPAIALDEAIVQRPDAVVVGAGVTGLSTAVALVYSYGLGVPVLLWLALRDMGVGEWSVIEAVAVWGYGKFVWLPVAVSPTRPLRAWV